MKNILLLDNKALDQYDFHTLKNVSSLKVFSVVTKNYFEKLPKHVLNNIDHFFVLEAVHSNFPEPFPEKKIVDIINENFADQIEKGSFFISCADEVNIPLAARLREQYSIPGKKTDITKRFTDKTLQKKLLTETSFKLPKFLYITLEQLKIASFNDLANQLGLPFIAKPNDKTASVCVKIIREKLDLINYISTAEIGGFNNLILESYQQGKLFHVDLVTVDGATLFAQPCEYFFNGLAFTKGYVHGSIPIPKDDLLHERLVEISKDVNKQLGLNNGCTHHEIFLTHDNNFVFLEAACRPPGSLVPLTYSNMFGFNLLNTNLLIDSDIYPSVLLKKCETYFFWAIFPFQMDSIQDSDLKFLQGKYSFQKQLLKNNYGESTSLVDKTATMIVSSESYDSLKQDFESLKKFSENHLITLYDASIA